MIFSAVVNLINIHVRHLRHLELDGEGLTDISFENIGDCVLLEVLKVSFAVKLTDISLSYIQV